MKLLKRLLIFVLVIVVILVAGVLILMKAIHVDVTDSDLPQTVYTSNGDLMGFAENAMLDYVTASQSDQYTIVEEVINYIILDSIRTNINAQYDPLSDSTDNAVNHVIDSGMFYIDYVYATLNDSNQLVVCASFGTIGLLASHSALYLTFDISVQVVLLNVNLTLTLSQVQIADQTISMSMLDFIMSKVDKTSIENSMTSGVLDLDNYTYTLSMLG